MEGLRSLKVQMMFKWCSQTRLNQVTSNEPRLDQELLAPSPSPQLWMGLGQQRMQWSAQLWDMTLWPSTFPCIGKRCWECGLSQGSECHSPGLLPVHNPGAPTSLPLICLQDQCAQTLLWDPGTLLEALLERAAALALQAAQNSGCSTPL